MLSATRTWGFAEDTQAEVVLYRIVLLITAAAAVVLWALRLRQKVVGTSTNGRVQHSAAALQSKVPEAELPTAAETMHLIQKRRSIFPKASVLHCCQRQLVAFGRHW